MSRSMPSLLAILSLVLCFFQVSLAARCTGTQTWYFKIVNKSNTNDLNANSLVAAYANNKGNIKLGSVSSECRAVQYVNGKKTCKIMLGFFSVHDTCAGTNIAGSQDIKNANLAVNNKPFAN